MCGDGDIHLFSPTKWAVLVLRLGDLEDSNVVHDYVRWSAWVVSRTQTARAVSEKSDNLAIYRYVLVMIIIRLSGHLPSLFQHLDSCLSSHAPEVSTRL